MTAWKGQLLDQLHEDLVAALGDYQPLSVTLTTLALLTPGSAGLALLELADVPGVVEYLSVIPDNHTDDAQVPFYNGGGWGVLDVGDAGQALLAAATAAEGRVAIGAARQLVATDVKTASYGAIVGQRVLVNVATTGSLTITMPSSPPPQQGDQVGVCSVAVHGSRTLTVAGSGGNNVQNAGDDGFSASTAWSQVVLVSLVYEFVTGIGWVRVQ